MGAIKCSEISSDRKKWDKIFNGLVHMLQTQQAQIETLAKERKLLEDRIRVQHERWISDVHLYEDRLSQMNGDLVVQQMTHSLEATKYDFVMGLEKRQAFLEKLKLEHAESELGDFKSWFDNISLKSSDPKGEERRSKRLEGEIKRLKDEYEKLASEKISEVSALLAEKKFVWNQYKIMENDYISKFRCNRTEVARANEKVKELLGSMEQLQLRTNEKDETIADLRNKVAKMEAETNKLNEEYSRLSQELDILKSSRSAVATPVLNRCTAGAKPSNVGAKNSGRNRSHINFKTESSAAAAAAQVPDSVKDNEKGSRGSKRKVVDVLSISDSETPKLFSSNFKVPKLKTEIRR